MVPAHSRDIHDSLIDMLFLIHLTIKATVFNSWDTEVISKRYTFIYYSTGSLINMIVRYIIAGS